MSRPTKRKLDQRTFIDNSNNGKSPEPPNPPKKQNKPRIKSEKERGGGGGGETWALPRTWHQIIQREASPIRCLQLPSPAADPCRPSRRRGSFLPSNYSPKPQAKWKPPVWGLIAFETKGLDGENDSIGDDLCQTRARSKWGFVCNMIIRKFIVICLDSTNYPYIF